MIPKNALNNDETKKELDQIKEIEKKCRQRKINLRNKWIYILILTWSRNCVTSSATGDTKFKTTETILYVPVVNLSTQENAKLLQQLKSGFKRTIKWNKYESNIKTFAQNRYLNHLINPSF